MKRWLPVLVLAVVMAGAVFVGSMRDEGPPTVSQRVGRIAREVRCPTCENLSAADSDAPSSEAIRAQIREQVVAGRTDAEVRAYLVDRYGKDILLKPEGSGLISLVWVLPVAGLVTALAGLGLVFRRWRRRARAASGPWSAGPSDADRALVASASAAGSGGDEEVAFLLTSLADLEREREAGDIDDVDYATLRDDYTVRAAALLRAAASGGVAEVEAEEGDGVGGGSWRPVAVALGVLAVAGLAGVAVARTAGERAPGQTITGNITETSGEKISRAAALSGEGKWLDAIKLYDEVIRAEPENVQALAYRGWLVRLTGRQANQPELIDRGLEFINRALAVDPKYPDANFFKAEILFRDKNDPAGAIPHFEAFMANGPPGMAPMVQKALDEAKAAAASTPK